MAGSTHKLIQQIPRNVWLEILWRLDHTDLTNLLCTCKYFHHLLASNDFWRDLLLLREAADGSPLPCQPARKRYKQLTTLRLTGNCVTGPGVRPFGAESCVFDGIGLYNPIRPIITPETCYNCVFQSVPPGRYLVAVKFEIPKYWYASKVFVFAHTGDCTSPTRLQTLPSNERHRKEVNFEVHRIHCSASVFEGPEELYLDTFRSVAAGLFFSEEVRSGTEWGRIHWVELRRQEGPLCLPTFKLTQMQGYHRVNASDCLPYDGDAYMIPNYGESDCSHCVWMQSRSLTYNLEYTGLPPGTYALIIEYFADSDFLPPDLKIQLSTHKTPSKRYQAKNFVWVRGQSEASKVDSDIVGASSL